MTIGMDSVLAPSGDIVVREIDGEIIIIPLFAGIGDMEQGLFALNGTAKAIWQRLDGRTNLRAVSTSLAQEYDAPQAEIERDVFGLVSELAQRRMLVDVACV
jgi:hypothetical protein